MVCYSFDLKIEEKLRKISFTIYIVINKKKYFYKKFNPAIFDSFLRDLYQIFIYAFLCFKLFDKKLDPGDKIVIFFGNTFQMNTYGYLSIQFMCIYFNVYIFMNAIF